MSATPRLLRRINAQRVLDALREGGPARVTELVARTELSRPTVDAVADDLVRLGWVEELVAATGGRGRPARSLAFQPRAGYVAGVDIGEVKVRAAVADLAGEVVAERLHLFDSEDRLPAIRATAAAVLADAGVASPVSSCVGCTGPMDPRTGHVLFSSVFPDDFDLAGAMASVLTGPLVVENDCNLAVIAEHARTGSDDIVCVLAGERVGAGIMVGGQILRGHSGAAGEIAFLALDEPSSGIAPLVRRLAGGREPQALFAAASAGDAEALAIVDQVERAFSGGVVMTAQLVNPEIVVLSGGAARAGEVLIAPLRRRVEAMVRMPPRVEASPLAERGPLLGAIRLALDALEPHLLDGLDDAAAVRVS